MTKEKSFAPCTSKKTQMCISIGALVVACKLNHTCVCVASQLVKLCSPSLHVYKVTMYPALFLQLVRAWIDSHPFQVTAATT